MRYRKYRKWSGEIFGHSHKDIHQQRLIRADLGLRQANERRRYKVTPSLIGWAQT